MLPGWVEGFFSHDGGLVTLTLGMPCPLSFTLPPSMSTSRTCSSVPEVGSRAKIFTHLITRESSVPTEDELGADDTLGVQLSSSLLVSFAPCVGRRIGVL